MERIKYKFDKKESIIWIVLFLINTIMFILSFFVSGMYHIVYLLVLFAFLSYYLANKYRLKKFYFLCNEIEKHKIDFKYEELYIKIKQKSYNIKSFGQSRDMKVEIPLYMTKAYIINTSDFFIIFFALKDFGLFKKYVKPFLFKKGNGVSYNFMKNKVIIEKEYEIKILDGELVVTLKKKLNDIEKIIIPYDVATAPNVWKM